MKASQRLVKCGNRVLEAQRLKVPFLVVDIAKMQDGRWIVIECNDAQESGYTGIVPQLLWRQVLQAIPPTEHSGNGG
ncbi:ATP-grasp domain-containing protein [Parachitinimonas caeni]|uniref:ATP-grasp domain-containing protein n=1 Tax=Parachitinimonas caeni TaxID=3031301 RepID=A0ABT7DSK9_9NEIS|nr:ATP-grasp domain-containing protein [Parachitinimonas caeni]MDK2123050.1 ATP-grasp domain-containing protein [Parachitinimonas caeni]